jgi:glycosyltransferase 2 family protein
LNAKVVKILKYLILLAVSIGLLFLAFRGMDLRKIVEEMLRANMLWVALSGLISGIAFIVRAHRWNLLIKPLGYSPSLKNTTCSVMVGYFANLAFPRLGEVSRCGALNKAESIPFNKLFGTVIVERVIDVISLLICMLIAAVIEFKRLGNFFS